MKIPTLSASNPILGAADFAGINYRLGLEYVQARFFDGGDADAKYAAIAEAHGLVPADNFFDAIMVAIDEGRFVPPSARRK